MVGIVIVEILARVEIEGAGAGEGGGVDVGPGGVGGAVDAVGAAAEDHCRSKAFQGQRGCQDEFLISAAFTFSVDGYGGLAAGQDAGGAAHGAGVGQPLFGDGGGDLGYFAGFPFDEGGKQEGPIAQVLGFSGGGVQCQAVAAKDDAFY